MFLAGQGVDVGLAFLAAQAKQLALELQLTVGVLLETRGCLAEGQLASLCLGMDLVGVAFGKGSCGAFGVGLCDAILLLGDRESLGQVAVRDGLPCGGKLLGESGDGLGRAVEVDIGAE